MTDQTKYIIAGVVALIVTSFACGRYTTPVQTKVEIKTVEIVKTVETVKTNIDTHQDKLITIEKKPDGTVTTRIETVTDTKTDQEKKNVTVADKSTEKSTEVTRLSSPVTISALGGLNKDLNPIFGGSIMKPLLGPTTMGLFFLSDMSGGVSLGLQF